MIFFNKADSKKDDTAVEPLYVPMPILLRNTMSGEKELFIPRRAGEVKMYNCGPTVYDHQHIGNLCNMVFADLLRRMFEYNQYSVRQVINITDVGHLTGDNEGDANTGEDKMDKGAAKFNMTAAELAKTITKEFHDDLELLGLPMMWIEWPRATEYIDAMIALTQTLEERGYTYKTPDGIYFDTARFPNYGKLGNINLEGLKEGARVEDHPERRNPSDFALWKFSPRNSTREQEWNSPWGIGFPGWHIECTAMIFALLGKQIDVHTGGTDHIPVHHNNEIAQAEAATGRKPYVHYWLHQAFITIEGKKVSKSIGNTIYLYNIIERGYDPLAYRYWLLTRNYHSQVNFTWTALDGAATALTKLQRFFVEELPAKGGHINEFHERRFHEAINNDLDTPKALSVLWELVKDGTVKKTDKRATLLAFDKVLGIGLDQNRKKLKKMISVNVVSVDEAPQEVRDLVTLREDARNAKDWKEADKLRDAIAEAGYTVKDTEKGPELLKNK